MVILAAKMLARLLIISGPAYVKKFVEKNGGMVILQYRLKRWWGIPTIWPICLAILFGQDIAAVNLERKFDLYNLLEIFDNESGVKIIYPEVLPVLTAMLRNGLKSITREQTDPESPSFGGIAPDPDPSTHDTAAPRATRAHSMSLDVELASSGLSPPSGSKLLCLADNGQAR